LAEANLNFWGGLGCGVMGFCLGVPPEIALVMPGEASPVMSWFARAIAGTWPRLRVERFCAKR
jgi:hypothetical protein